MSTLIEEGCIECGEQRPYKISNTPIWFECKTCGYYEDAFKGPSITMSRQRDPKGPFTQYL